MGNFIEAFQCCCKKDNAVVGIGRTERLPSELFAAYNEGKFGCSHSPVRQLTIQSKVKNSDNKLVLTPGTERSDITRSVTTSSKFDRNGNLRLNEVKKRRTIDSGETTFFRNKNDTKDTTSEGNTSFMRKEVCSLQYAIYSQRGFHPYNLDKPNQDDFSATPDFGYSSSDHTSTLFTLHDGHGPYGEIFSSYAKEHLPKLLAKFIQQERARLYKERRKNDTDQKSNHQIISSSFNPKLFPNLSEVEFETALTNAHLECNHRMMNDFSKHQVNLSGTTSLCTLLYDGKLIVSNVGDSRAVLGCKLDTSKNDNRNSCSLVAIPLSKDQTPWRRDERDRIIRSGGRILTFNELDEYRNSFHDMERTFGDHFLGEDDFFDILGDPPRVWLSDQTIPGTSFTRSLGDAVAESVGVNAEPEFFSKVISDDDEVIVLGSDGVFEFLSNQSVIDICANCDSPLEACEEIVERSYNEWLQYEQQTDDITIMVIFLFDRLLEQDKSKEKAMNLLDEFAMRSC